MPAFRRGDLETYGRVGDEVTAVLLAASRRVERPSADEAFVDLTPEPRTATCLRCAPPRRSATSCSGAWASTPRSGSPRRVWRRASPRAGPSRAACSWCCRATSARSSRRSPWRCSACRRTSRGRSSARGSRRSASWPRPIGRRSRASSAPRPPSTCSRWRAARASRRSRWPRRRTSSRRRRRCATARATGSRSAEIAESLARRAARRLKPFRLGATAIAVEVRRAADSSRRATTLGVATADEDRIAETVRGLAPPLVEPADAVRGLLVRLARLGPDSPEAPLFPAAPAFRRAL